jgi:short-subunit dehydrogenase
MRRAAPAADDRAVRLPLHSQSVIIRKTGTTMARGDDLKGRWALVTGASSGLGADFARELAAMGCNLVLVARRKERLVQLGAEIEAAHRVKALPVACDLTVPDAPQALFDSLQRDGIRVDVLVNNAGTGPFGHTLELPWEKIRQSVMLDVVALVQMTRLFAGEMIGRGFGRILQIGSTTGYQPVPSMACYGASKAFVRSFAEALAVEIRGTGVTCTVLNPGYTATEFFAANDVPMTPLMRVSLMPGSKVARIGIRAMLAGKPSITAGSLNRFIAWTNRLFPRRWMALLAQVLMRPPRRGRPDQPGE